MYGKRELIKGRKQGDLLAPTPSLWFGKRPKLEIEG